MVKSSTTSGQLDIFKFSDVPSTSELRCTPCWRHLVVRRSTTSGQFDIFTFANVPGTSELRCTPGRGTEWSRAVLCQVSLTFGEHLGQADLQSDIPSW